MFELSHHHQFNIGKGFTLAELLIALSILGVIATFTIPKILTTQQNSKYNATAHEAASMIAAAYTAYSKDHAPSASTTPGDLTPYMNFVAADSSSTVDAFYEANTHDCATYPCLKLHNGGMFSYETGGFTGTSTTHAIYFYFDPDGRVTDGTTNGPGKSVCFWLYFNGRISSYANITPGTVYAAGTVNPDPVSDPPWFSW